MRCADVAICVGSSLRVLKQYRGLWVPPTLAIVNLQWTPKDRIARLKINAPCDDVLLVCRTI
jgi:hypothetical protein